MHSEYFNGQGFKEGAREEAFSDDYDELGDDTSGFSIKEEDDELTLIGDEPENDKSEELDKFNEDGGDW